MLICALLLAALSMPALAAEGDVLLHCGENEDAISEYIATACAVGDTLYLAAYEDAFYAVAPGAEPEKYAFSGEYGELEYDENVSRYLLSDGERPVLLSILRRSDGSMEAGLFAISLSGGGSAGGEDRRCGRCRAGRRQRARRGLAGGLRADPVLRPDGRYRAGAAQPEGRLGRVGVVRRRRNLRLHGVYRGPRAD